MCSQKPDCFPGWSHLNLMTLSERRMFPLSCHYFRNLSHPWSAVMEGWTQDAKKTIVRTFGSPLVALSLRGGSTPTTGPYLGLSFGSNIAFKPAPARYVSSRRFTAPSVFRDLAPGPCFPRIQGAK